MRLYPSPPMKISLISLKNTIGNNQNLSKSELFSHFHGGYLRLLPPPPPLLDRLPQPVLPRMRQDHRNLLFPPPLTPSRDFQSPPQIAASILFQNHRLSFHSATTTLPESYRIRRTEVLADITWFTMATIGNNSSSSGNLAWKNIKSNE